MRSRRICIIVTLVLGVTGVVRADEEYDQLKAKLAEARRKFNSEFDTAAEKVGWKDRTRMPDTDKLREINELAPAHRFNREEFHDRFFAYAEKHAGRPEAMEAWAIMLTMTSCNCVEGKMEETPTAEQAFERLCQDHADAPDIGIAMDVLHRGGFCLRPESLERLYKSIETKNKNPEVIAKARLARADLYERKRMFARMVRNPTYDLNAEEKASDGILRGIVKDYPTTVAGRSAEARLFKKDNLQIGQNLPNFDGKDFSGKWIQLSQFRGQVVMVVFWASWCGPCMARVPEEREVATKFVGKPFTILGVNSDRTREAFRKVMAKEVLPWPNIFDGDPKTGPIVNALRIESFPTVYLLDHEGVIRYEGLHGERLEKAIKELIAKVPKSDKPTTSQPAA